MMGGTMGTRRWFVATIVWVAAALPCCDVSAACFVRLFSKRHASHHCCHRLRRARCDTSQAVLRTRAAHQLDRIDPQTDAVRTLERFLESLAREDFPSAYALVAPSSKIEGDPIAYRAKLDAESFREELFGVELEKFAKYELGASRWESPNRFRIWLHFGGDNHEALIVREEGQWYVADPIHIIR